MYLKSSSASLAARLAASAAAVWILLLLLTSMTVQGASVPQAASPIQRRQSLPVSLYADPRQVELYVAPPQALLRPNRPLTTLTIHYLAAGTPNVLGDTCQAYPVEARPPFEYAANIWAGLLQSSVPIVIEACWCDMGSSSILGHSAAVNDYANFTHAPYVNTWYQVALANALAGSDLNGSSPEISIAYNSGFAANFYYGTDQNTPSSQYNFASIVLHEIGHGLGFSGSMNKNGASGSWGYGTGMPRGYDRFAADGAGLQLIDTATYPNPSNALGTALTSGQVYFTGPNARAANGGQAVRLYAPSTWASGSSFSHLDVIFDGTLNALMTYSIGKGETLYSPGPVTMGILHDLGWNAAPPAPTATLTSSPTHTHTPSPTPTQTPTRTPTRTPTAPVPTNTPWPSSTPQPYPYPGPARSAYFPWIIRFLFLSPPPTPTPDGMILIPAGSFQMGCSANDADCQDSERPLHTVTLEAYWIDLYEVSNARYAACVSAGACTAPSQSSSNTRTSYYGNPTYDHYPVLYVDWNQAAAFCAWEGKRLPTEAEWEKAARGSSDTRIYPWGDLAADCAHANFDISGVRTGKCVDDTLEVTSNQAGASAYGVVNMSGNAYEWVSDWYDSGYYAVSPSSNPFGPLSGTYRVLRGGTWDSFLDDIRTSNRNWDPPSMRDNRYGMRCARSQ